LIWAGYDGKIANGGMAINIEIIKLFFSKLTIAPFMDRYYYEKYKAFKLRKFILVGSAVNKIMICERISLNVDLK